MMRTTGRTGYTMIEVVVVMLVMGILAAVAAPRYISSLNRYRVEAAARRIVADLNHARSIAMSTGTQQTVDFRVSTNIYTFMNNPDIDHSELEYVVKLDQTAYPATLVSNVFTNTNGFDAEYRIRFNMHGQPQSGRPPTNDPIAPLVNGQIVVASGSETRTVVIDPVTGKASVL